MPWQELLFPDQVPKETPLPPYKTDKLLRGPGADVNVQDMDQWSVFTGNLRYMVNGTPAPGFDMQGQGCLYFSHERTHRLDGAEDVRITPLISNICLQVNLWIDI